MPQECCAYSCYWFQFWLFNLFSIKNSSVSRITTVGSVPFRSNHFVLRHQIRKMKQTEKMYFIGSPFIVHSFPIQRTLKEEKKNIVPTVFDKKTEMFRQISPCRVSPSLSGDNLESEVSFSTQIIFNRFCCFSVSLFLLGKESPPLLWRNVIEQMVNENRVMEISFFILSTVSSNVTQNIAWLVSLFCILVIFFNM